MNKLLYSLFIVIGTLLYLAGGTQASNATDGAVETGSPTEQPNIIFYLSDDQNVYDYGCYGNEKVKTSGADRLAEEGLRFTNAFTGQAICAPSRSQLYSGKYPLKNSCWANHTYVKPDIKSVTKHMRELGYQVILAGKSHVNPKEVFDWDISWQTVPDAGSPKDLLPLDSINNYLKTAAGPFCMFITSRLPHPEYFKVENPRAEDIKFYPFNERRKTDTAYVRTMAGYYRSIEEDNKQLEAVLDMVDKHLGTNTLFIYSADHGAYQKFSVKDAGLRGAFIARWPGVITPGATSDQLIHYTDVLPTFMQIAGGEAPEDMDGNSFLPLLRGENVEINEYVYGVRTNQNILRSEVFPSRMIHDKHYKYIRNFNALEVLDKNLGGKPNVNLFLRRGAMAFKDEPFEELYDLDNDPFEIENLIDRSEHQQRRAELTKSLFAWMKSQGDFLDDRFGNLPLITPPTDRRYNLGRDTRKRQIADSLKNTLNGEDFFVIEHWK